jgi:hypothetical protein
MKRRVNSKDSNILVMGSVGWGFGSNRENKSEEAIGGGGMCRKIVWAMGNGECGRGQSRQCVNSEEWGIEKKRYNPC